MKEFLDRLSSYNLFTNFLPGILFALIAQYITSYRLLQDNILVALFEYYFIGLVISRFGSLMVEPLLKKVSFLKFAKYEEFVAASHKDQKLDLLSEVNNTYRSICSMCVLLLLLKVWDLLVPQESNFRGASIYVLIAIVLAFFLFSYRKQTNFIAKRVGGTKK